MRSSYSMRMRCNESALAGSTLGHFVEPSQGGPIGFEPAFRALLVQARYRLIPSQQMSDGKLKP